MRVANVCIVLYCKLGCQDEMGELLDCLREKDEDVFHRWTKSEAWATVEQLLDANGTISTSLLSVSAVVNRR